MAIMALLFIIVSFIGHQNLYSCIIITLILYHRDVIKMSIDRSKQRPVSYITVPWRHIHCNYNDKGNMIFIYISGKLILNGFFSIQIII
jgi:hypothetical protein